MSTNHKKMVRYEIVTHFSLLEARNFDGVGRRYACIQYLVRMS